MTDRYAEWDAAYVLGALDPAERRQYAAHLETCEACRTAVAELAALPGLLASVPLDALPPADDADVGTPASGARGTRPKGSGRPGSTSGDVVPIAVPAVSARRRRARRRGGLVAAAAGIAVVAGVAGGLTGGGWWFDEAPPSSGTTAPPAAAARELELLPVGGTGMRATLTATPTAWGTRLEWSCRYDGPLGPTPPAGGYGDGGATSAPQPVTYELVLVDQAGTRVVAATWTSAGREVTGLGASSAVPLASVDRVEIAVAGRPEPLAAASL